MTGSSRATKARQLGDNPPRLVLGEQLGRRSPAGLILGAVFHDKAGVQFLDRPGRREATLRSLRQARHSLKLEDQPQRGHRIEENARFEGTSRRQENTTDMPSLVAHPQAVPIDSNRKGNGAPDGLNA